MSLLDWLWRKFDRTKREFPLPFERTREPQDRTGRPSKGDGKVYPLRGYESGPVDENTPPMQWGPSRGNLTWDDDEDRDD